MCATKHVYVCAYTSLLSAHTGGQWPQSRLASTRTWVSDNQCQLCHEHPGTLSHRRVCAATRPASGWAQPPESTASFIGSLEVGRSELAQDRAILMAQIVLPSRPPHHNFSWLKPLPEQVPEDATWYIDGSMIGGRHNATKRLGYGIVVVGRDGTLLAYGNGRPPSWITDSAGAECWAYFWVLSLNAHRPSVITDCLGILSMLSLGRASATLATRPLARIWGLIYYALDDDYGSNLVNSKIVWMLAHEASGSIGRSLKSDGHPVTAIDWRANRLVDHLARLAACIDQVPACASNLYKHFFLAAEHLAASLGAVTYTANHFRTEVIDCDGKLVTRTCRDSEPGIGAGKAPRGSFSAEGSAECIGPEVGAVPAQQGPCTPARARSLLFGLHRTRSRYHVWVESPVRPPPPSLPPCKEIVNPKCSHICTQTETRSFSSEFALAFWSSEAIDYKIRLITWHLVIFFSLSPYIYICVYT